MEAEGGVPLNRHWSIWRLVNASSTSPRWPLPDSEPIEWGSGASVVDSMTVDDQGAASEAYMHGEAPRLLQIRMASAFS